LQLANALDRLSQIAGGNIAVEFGLHGACFTARLPSGPRATNTRFMLPAVTSATSTSSAEAASRPSSP